MASMAMTTWGPHLGCCSAPRFPLPLRPGRLPRAPLRQPGAARRFRRGAGAGAVGSSPRKMGEFDPETMGKSREEQRISAATYGWLHPAIYGF